MEDMDLVDLCIGRLMKLLGEYILRNNPVLIHTHDRYHRVAAPR